MRGQDSSDVPRSFCGFPRSDCNDDVDVLREQRPDLAIIDRATWDAVQVRLDEHTKNYKVRPVPHNKTGYLLTGLLECGGCGRLMQISGGSPYRYYRCVSNRKRGVCGNRLSVRESLARERILEAIHRAVASPDAAAYVRHRLAERMGALARESRAELTERSGRLKRVEERVRSIILLQVDGVIARPWWPRCELTSKRRPKPTGWPPQSSKPRATPRSASRRWSSLRSACWA